MRGAPVTGSPALTVSIRARPGGRAMRLGGGEFHLLDSRKVSIRARPGGRAMPTISRSRSI